MSVTLCPSRPPLALSWLTAAWLAATICPLLKAGEFSGAMTPRLIGPFEAPDAADVEFADPEDDAELLLELELDPQPETTTANAATTSAIIQRIFVLKILSPRQSNGW
jgi:hypothetical protein